MAFGQAPDDLAGVFKQRLRWAMGALQILMRDNPLKRPGLSFAQSLLFWEAAAHHFLAVTTMLLGFLPVIYVFTEVCIQLLCRVQLCLFSGLVLTSHKDSCT